jgi:hypothetical protein
MRRIVICDLYNIFLHCLISGKIFDTIIKHKIWVLIFYTVFVLNIFHYKKKLSEILLKMSNGRHVKYLLFLSDFNETWTA